MTPDAATLLARIAAVEAVARAAMENERSGEWEAYALPDPGATRWPMIGVGIAGDREMGHRTETMFPQDAAHIALNDPARVLAVCAGAKTLVELHHAWAPTGFRYTSGEQILVCAVDESIMPCPTLLAVAAMFAGPGEEDDDV